MLNESQRKFVEATVRGATPKDAAIAAGLSENTARTAGARMRKHPKVVAALEAIGFATPAPLSAREKAAQDPTLAAAASEIANAVQAEEEAATELLPETTDSLEFLEAVMSHPKISLSRRMDAAKTLLPFQHAKIGEKGKKETKADGAKAAAAGGNAYATRKPPPLKAVPN